MDSKQLGKIAGQEACRRILMAHLNGMNVRALKKIALTAEIARQKMQEFARSDDEAKKACGEFHLAYLDEIDAAIALSQR